MGTLHSRQIDEVDPLGVRSISLHDLGEYEACQSELQTLLPFDPVCSLPLPKHTLRM
jgi:hypothetical protein